MPLIEERYEPSKVEKVRKYLQREDEKGRSRDYEIIVDGFKVVPRTNDLSEFEDYEDDVDEHTRNVTIVIFDGESNRNTKYSFAVNTEKHGFLPAHPVNGLGSLGDVDALIQQRLDEKEKDFTIRTLQEKLEAKEEELEEAQEHMKLQGEQIEQLKAQRFKVKNGDLPELLGQALSGFLKGPGKNPLGGLSALLGLPADTTAPPAAEGAGQAEEATFREKGTSETPSPLAELIGCVQKALNEEQMQGLLFVISHLAENPAQIPQVIAFITKNNG